MDAWKRGHAGRPALVGRWQRGWFVVSAQFCRPGACPRRRVPATLSRASVRICPGWPWLSALDPSDQIQNPSVRLGLLAPWR
jgi:hypothetical protein